MLNKMNLEEAYSKRPKVRVHELTAAERLQIYNVAKVVRKWLADHYGVGVNMAGHCIEASEFIVNILRAVGMEQVKTQAGYVHYDNPMYAEDPYEPHMWVEIQSGEKKLYLDVTADQFNYGMDPEFQFPDIVFTDSYPHGVRIDQGDEVWETRESFE